MQHFWTEKLPSSGQFAYYWKYELWNLIEISSRSFCDFITTLSFRQNPTFWYRKVWRRNFDKNCMYAVVWYDICKLWFSDYTSTHIFILNAPPPCTTGDSYEVQFIDSYSPSNTSGHGIHNWDSIGRPGCHHCITVIRRRYCRWYKSSSMNAVLSCSKPSDIVEGCRRDHWGWDGMLMCRYTWGIAWNIHDVFWCCVILYKETQGKKRNTVE